MNGAMYSSNAPHSVGLDEIESLKVAANALYSDGKFNQAVIGYSYAIKQMASLVVPASRRAMVNLDSGLAVAQAIRDARVEGKGPALAAVLYCNRAAAYLKMGRNEKAAQDAGAAAIIEPGNFKAWYRKAMAHKELNQWYECHMATKNALELQPDNTDVQALFQESQFKMGMSMNAGMGMGMGMGMGGMGGVPQQQMGGDGGSDSARRRKKFGIF